MAGNAEIAHGPRINLSRRVARSCLARGACSCSFSVTFACYCSSVVPVWIKKKLQQVLANPGESSRASGSICFVELHTVAILEFLCNVARKPCEISRSNGTLKAAFEHRFAYTFPPFFPLVPTLFASMHFYIRLSVFISAVS